MFNVLIVDDEPLAREELSRLVAGDADFKIAGEAKNGLDAIEAMKKNIPDIVFLDIEMPGMSGLEVAARIADWPKPPCVVFATAYNQYAIEAFDANAIDYILKPYEPERLKKTLMRIKEFKASQKSPSESLKSLEQDLVNKGLLKRIVGHRRNSKDKKVMDPAQIYYFYANNEEVFARLESEELIIKSTLKELLEKLDGDHFAQTHKAYIVNLDKLEKVAPMFNGNFEISLKSSAEDFPKIPLSRRYAKSLKEKIGGW